MNPNNLLSLGSSTYGYSQQGAVLPCPSLNLGMTPPKAVSGKVLSQLMYLYYSSVLAPLAVGFSPGGTELGNAGQIAGRNQHLDRVSPEGVGPHLGKGWEAAGETGVLGRGRASVVT